ncbi:MAG: MFS transporter [Acidimicrobiia bacterium]|nr:MFS transporter [Acidimicrobiia bacterium]
MGTATGRWVLVATVLGSGMAMLDGTVVNLALPRMGEDLDASFGGLQWILNGYTLTLASLILLGGGLGDRLGRRRVFTIGAAWFTVASLLAGVAPTVEVLVAARVLQGIGGALLTPGSLAILQASFHHDDRARAIGAWSGLGGVAAAIGPFLGGWLVDALSWRWIFLINLPVGIAVVVLARQHVPESRDEQANGRVDAPGAVIGALALAGLTLGLSEQNWALTAAGAAVLVTFVVVETRRAHPLLPMAVFRSSAFSGTNIVTVLLYGTMAVVFFLLGLVLQGPLGYSPLRAGAATVPITIAMLALSARAGALAERIGSRLPMTVGPLLVAGSLLLMTRIDEGSSYVSDVLPAIIVFGLGLTLTVAPLTATALASVEDHLAGVASGINNAVARTGQLLAIAAVPALAQFVPGQPVGPDDLTSGFHRVLWVGAVVLVAAAAVSWTTVGRGAPGTAEAECFHCAAGGPPPPVRQPAAVGANRPPTDPTLSVSDPDASGRDR